MDPSLEPRVGSVALSARWPSRPRDRARAPRPVRSRQRRRVAGTAARRESDEDSARDRMPSYDVCRRGVRCAGNLRVSLDCSACHTALLCAASHMKVAFTHNLRLTDVRETEKEAEYDSAETVERDRGGARSRRARGREGRGLGAGLEPARAARGDRSRHHLQHGRGPSRADARGVLPGAVRGARHPVHRLGRVHERAHARQVADQADRPARRASTPPRGMLVTVRNFEPADRARRSGWRSR